MQSKVSLYLQTAFEIISISNWLSWCFRAESDRNNMLDKVNSLSIILLSLKLEYYNMYPYIMTNTEYAPQLSYDALVLCITISIQSFPKMEKESMICK